MTSEDAEFMQFRGQKNLKIWRTKFGFNGKLSVDSCSALVKDIRAKGRGNQKTDKKHGLEQARNWLCIAYNRKPKKKRNTLALEDSQDINAVTSRQDRNLGAELDMAPQEPLLQPPSYNHGVDNVPTVPAPNVLYTDLKHTSPFSRMLMQALPLRLMTGTITT